MDLNECCMTKLLVESKEAKPGVLSTVTGTFMELDVKNRNGRIYSRPLVVERIMQEPYVKEMLEAGMLLGEAKHPEDRFEVDMEKASHVVTNLWIDEDENVLKGEADILDTPCGRIVNTLVQYGSSVGISARARGNVKSTKDGDLVLKESYRFKTFDFVLTPGFAKSRLERVNEGLDEVKESIDTIINSASDNSLEAIKSLLFSVDEEYFKESIQLIVSKQESSEIHLLKEENMELVRQITELELQVDEMQIDRESMVASTEVTERDSQISSLREQLESLTEQNRGLQEELQGLQSYQSVVELLKDANSQLANKYNQSNTLLNIVTSKLEESLSDIAKLKEELAKREEENKSLTGTVTSLTESIKELKESNSFIEEEEERPIILVESIVEEKTLTDNQVKLMNLIGGINNGK